MRRRPNRLTLFRKAWVKSRLGPLRYNLADMPHQPNRRDFARITAAAAASALSASAQPGKRLIDDFERPDSFYAGDGWHSLNPGYWRIENKALRRQIHTRGERARKTGFPFHRYMETEYEFLPPYGMIWRRDWKLERNFAFEAEFVIHAEPEKRPEPGYSLMGVCFGSRTIYESWDFKADRGDACWFACWRDDGRFGVYDHATNRPVNRLAEKSVAPPKPGDRGRIEVAVSGESGNMAVIDAKLYLGDAVAAEIHLENFDRSDYTNGFFGLVGRGWLDFEFQKVSLDPQRNEAQPSPVNELRVAYPLGDSLREVDGKWYCRFLAIFRQEGRNAQIRISTSEKPDGGWGNVASAGTGGIVTNGFRLATAVIDCELPANPADAELYYTVWKDGQDVTADPRPEAQRYIGRLPQLKPPYKLCGLSCHAIHGRKPGMERTAAFQENWIHPQPMRDAYLYLEHFDFQVMLWEDDVWYLELLLYPTSTDDAYNIIMTTLANPTTRWQMMRHWNVINPGDHDHGMDDVKGPEQLAIRNRADLGARPRVHAAQLRDRAAPHHRRRLALRHGQPQTLAPLEDAQRRFFATHHRLASVAHLARHAHLGNRGLGRPRPHLRPQGPHALLARRRAVRLARGDHQDRLLAAHLPDRHQRHAHHLAALVRGRAAQPRGGGLCRMGQGRL